MAKIEFKGAQGDILAAKLDVPSSEPRYYALFAHCFTCTKDIKPANDIVKTLNKYGIAVFRFDFTGLGNSSGDFQNTNFSSNVQDLVCAAEYMKENLQSPALMIGHSLGGTATLIAASKVPECKSVAVIGSPSNATNVIKQFEADVEKIEQEGEADVMLAGRPFKIKKQFLDDARQQNITNTLSSLKKALLILHSPVDETVAIDHAAELYESAKHPKSFISLDKADHLLFKKGAAEYVARSIAAFGSYYNIKE